MKRSVLVLGISMFMAQAGMCATAPSYCTTPGEWANVPEVTTLLPSSLQTDLGPYLSASARLSKETGMPLVRPVCADFPRDENVASVTDEYMIGPGLLVAPIAGGSSRDVYLPLARWYNYWTGRVIGGGRSVQFDTTEGPLPIYVRGSSIIPTSGTNGELTFRVYAGYAPASCTLCPDGGKGCTLRAYRSPNGTEIAVNPGPDCPQKSVVFVINLPYREVASATVNGQTLPQLAVEQVSTAAQGWNQDGIIVRAKVPISKELIRLEYKLWVY